MRWLKNILILLIFLTINLNIFAEEPTYPTDEQVMELIKSNPELIIPMVQKLWVLEHSDPVLTLPDLIFLEVNENLTKVNDNFSQGISNYTIVMFEDKPATLKIGTDEFNLLYDIDLSVAKVVYTPPEQKSTGVPVWEVILIGAGCFGVGFFVGYLVFH